ncbi:hypothetical protein [Streptomyces sp. NPDC058623]|uniref:hypothetical protein n=1 Tax=Streptomyces sp. NPDC058623 TaxID=3346563 RepID=UPI00364AECE6
MAYGRSTPRLHDKRMLWRGPAGGPAAEYEDSGLGALRSGSDARPPPRAAGATAR